MSVRIPALIRSVAVHLGEALNLIGWLVFIGVTGGLLWGLVRSIAGGGEVGRWALVILGCWVGAWALDRLSRTPR